MTLEFARLTIVLAGAAALPATPTVNDLVDVIELNHVYDGDGQRVLSQYIFWDWHECSARHHVVAWRLWKSGQPHPVRDWPHGGYTLVFHDGQVMRIVRAKHYHETWTQFDPEIDDRRRLSQDRRRKLSKYESPASASPNVHARR